MILVRGRRPRRAGGAGTRRNCGERGGGRAGGHDIFWVSTSRCSGGMRARPLGRAAPPFTSPSGDLDADPGTWRSRAYDVLLDGWELAAARSDQQVPTCSRRFLRRARDRARGGEGALRIPARGAQLRRATARRHRIRIDRPWRCWHGRDSIRDAIAFPKAASGADPSHGRARAGGRAAATGAGVKVDAPPPAGYPAFARAPANGSNRG